MQGGYEPRGGRRPGRATYLFRRVLVVVVVVALIAFILPRACGALIDADDSATGRGGTDLDSSGGEAGSSGGSGESAPSGTADDQDAPVISVTATPDGDAVEDAADDPAPEGGDGAMPETVEERLTAERPERPPRGIPTISRAERRRAQPGIPLEPLRTATAGPLRRAAVVEPAVRGEEVLVTVPVEVGPPIAGAATEVSAPSGVVTTEVVRSGRGARRATVADPADAPAARREARTAVAGVSVPATVGGGPEDGGDAASTAASARGLMEAVPETGDARSAVRGAVRDVEEAESMGSSVDEEEKKRCAKRPKRCLSVDDLLE